MEESELALAPVAPSNPPPKCPVCGGNTSSEGQKCNKCK